MFEGEGDKKKKVYPACPIVGQEGYTLLYIRLLISQSLLSCFHTSG